MAWNQELLQLSRNVLEPYVGNYLKEKREKIKDWELAEGIDDTVNKIDLFINTIDNVKCPLQSKVRRIDSDNFTLADKDIRPEQKHRIFAFIDKTFSDDTISKMHNMPINEAVQQMQNEKPHVFIETQEAIQQGIKNKSIKLHKDKYGGEYYIIPKTFLKEIK